MQRKEWHDRVMAQIRFKPDHGAIRRELMAHLDDKRDALKAAGWSEADANERAVAAMGDPEEVGRQLNAVHKPLLGWIWKISGWLAMLLAVIAVGCLLFGSNNYWYRNESMDSPYLERELTAYSREDHTEYRLWYSEECSCEDEWMRYTFRVERAALWDNGLLCAHLRIHGFLPWEESFWLREMYAVDDLGNRYENPSSTYWSWSSEPDWERYINAWIGDSRGLFHWDYRIEVLGVDPAAKWVELRYDWTGADIALRIDLAGGEGK